MPLYEYRCTACGYKFEKIQKFSDEPLSICPKCEGQLVRPMTAPALRFEGAGWYVNDYAGKGAAKTADTPGSDSAAKDAKPEAKPAAESRPASTPATAPAAAPAATTASPTTS